MHRAGELRHELTPAEKKLWAHLCTMREDGIHFRRQHAIGPFITDFCAPRKKLVIELDGSQHLEQEKYDEERTKYLESKGYKVIRFWNNEVMNNYRKRDSCHPVCFGRKIMRLQAKVNALPAPFSGQLQSASGKELRPLSMPCVLSGLGGRCPHRGAARCRPCWRALCSISDRAFKGEL